MFSVLTCVKKHCMMVLFPKDLFHTEWLILTHQCKELDEEGLSMRIFSFSLRTEVNRWTANVVLMELQASFPETLRERIHRAAVSIPHFSNLSTWTIFRPFFFFVCFFLLHIALLVSSKLKDLTFCKPTLSLSITEVSECYIIMLLPCYMYLFICY